MKECITHHFACDCREEKIQKVIEAAKEVVDYYWWQCKPKCIVDIDMAIRDFEGRK